MNTVVETDADKISQLSKYAARHNRGVDLERATNPVRLAILALQERGAASPYHLRLWFRTGAFASGWVDPEYLSRDAVGLSVVRSDPPGSFYSLREVLEVKILEGNTPATDARILQ